MTKRGCTIGGYYSRPPLLTAINRLQNSMTEEHIKKIFHPRMFLQMGSVIERVSGHTEAGVLTVKAREILE
jgi:hypothetical protein